GRRPQLREDGFKLAAHDFWPACLDSADALGVLSGNARERSRAMNTDGGKRLQIGLDARAAAAIRAGNGQSDWNGRFLLTTIVGPRHALAAILGPDSAVKTILCWVCRKEN